MRDFLKLLRDKYTFNSHIYYNELEEAKNKKIQKKFNAALDSYAKLVPDETPLLLFDSTLFGSAKDGFILTTKGIHIHSGYSSEKHASFITYKDLWVSQNEKDLMINGSKFSMIPLSVNDVARIVEVINLCKDKFTESNSNSVTINETTSTTSTKTQQITQLTQQLKTLSMTKTIFSQLSKTYPNLVLPYDENEIYDEETQKRLRSNLSIYAEFTTNEIIFVHYDNSLFDPSTKNLFTIILTNKGLHFNDVSYRKEHKKIFIAYKDLSVSKDEENLILKSSATETISAPCQEKNSFYNLINDCRTHFAGVSSTTDKSSTPKNNKQELTSDDIDFLTWLGIFDMKTAMKLKLHTEHEIRVRLYGHEFPIYESGICEARGRHLVLESTKKVAALVEKQVLSYHSIDEVIRKVPKLAGAIYLKTIQHLLYVLKREGITNINARKIFECVITTGGGLAVNILCKDLLKDLKVLSKQEFKDNRNKIAKFAVNAINFDLGNMWRGYVFAHGYDPDIEQFSVKRFGEMKITKELSNKNLPIDRVAELMVKILQYAPDWIEAYKVIESRLGKNSTLETYKKWFTDDFKAGSYHDISDGSMSKAQAHNKINEIISRYKNKFDSGVYFCGDDETSNSKIKLAIAHYAEIPYGEIPILCYDATVFGDASDGFLVTTKGIHIHNISKKTIYFDHSQISSIKVKGFVTSSLYINDIKIDTSGENKTFRKNMCEMLLLIQQAFEEKEG